MKSTLGEGGPVRKDQSPSKKKIEGKKPKEKTVWFKGPSLPMVNHVIDLVFKPQPHIIGVHVGVRPKFKWECLGVQFFSLVNSSGYSSDSV